MLVNSLGIMYVIKPYLYCFDFSYNHQASENALRIIKPRRTPSGLSSLGERPPDHQASENALRFIKPRRTPSGLSSLGESPPDYQLSKGSRNRML